MSPKKGGGRFVAVPPSKIFGPEMGRRIEMSDVLLKLENAISEVKSRFDALQETERGLAEKRSAIDKEISENRVEQLRLQGEYRALLSLKDKPEGSPDEKAN